MFVIFNNIVREKRLILSISVEYYQLLFTLLLCYVINSQKIELNIIK